MIIRRMCEGAVKCALRDFRREELTLRWAGGGVVRGSVGTESSGQAGGATGYYQLTELSCCSVPRHPDSRKKGQGRAAPGGVLHGRDCPLETAFDPWSVIGDIASDDPRLRARVSRLKGWRILLRLTTRGPGRGGGRRRRRCCAWRCVARPGKLNVYSFLLLTKPCLTGNSRVRRSSSHQAAVALANLRADREAVVGVADTGTRRHASKPRARRGPTRCLPLRAVQLQSRQFRSDPAPRGGDRRSQLHPECSSAGR